MEGCEVCEVCKPGKAEPRYVVWCGVRGRVAHLLSSRLETGAAAAVTVVTVVSIATAQSSAECEGEHSSSH